MRRLRSLRPRSVERSVRRSVRRTGCASSGWPVRSSAMASAR